MNNHYRSFLQKDLLRALILILLWPAALFAQDEKELAPVTRTYAITNVNIIQAPGRRIEMATLVVKDGLIVSAGKGVVIPPGAVVIKADSMYVYAGFIDGLSHTGVTKPKDENKDKVKDPGNPAPDRAGINPQLDVRNFLIPADKSVEELRNIGFAVAQVVPFGNLLSGQASIVLLGGKSSDDMVLSARTALYSELSGAGNVYPSTILGVMAKWRELYRQAALAKSYEALYASNRSGLARPSEDRILQAFYPVIDQKTPVLFRAEKILDVQRVFALKSDLNFPLILADVKEGWPIINKIKASGVRVFLSIDLPEEKKKEDKKEVKKNEKSRKDSTGVAAKPKTVADLEKEALEKRRDEAIANYTAQAAHFQNAGVPFGFSTMSAKSKDIQANLRRMIAAGLSEDAALAALTTAPAQLLGLSDRLGTIDNGKMANLVISDKPYFNEKAKVRFVFVDGMLYTVEIKESKKSDGGTKAIASGTWSYAAETSQGTNSGKVVIKDENGSYSGTITSSFSPDKERPLATISLDGNNLTFSYAIDAGGNKVNVEVTVTIDGDTFEGTMTAGQFGSFPIKATKDPRR